MRNKREGDFFDSPPLSTFALYVIHPGVVWTQGIYIWLVYRSDAGLFKVLHAHVQRFSVSTTAKPMQFQKPLSITNLSCDTLNFFNENKI